MDNQTKLPSNGATQSSRTPAEAATTYEQSVTLKWGFVFHKFNSVAGDFLKIDINTSDSLGAVMERVKARYQELQPKSWLKRLISKVVVERATVDHSPTYDIESQTFPMQVRANSNIKDDQLTEAFHNPPNFNGVPAQDAAFATFSLPQTTPSPQVVVSLRTVVSKKRLFWVLVVFMLGILVLAGIITGVVSKNMTTTFAVLGTLMGLFCLFVAIAALVWKS